MGSEAIEPVGRVKKTQRMYIGEVVLSQEVTKGVDEVTKGVDSGSSSIEKSRKVENVQAPSSGFPILRVPTQEIADALAIESLNKRGRVKLDFASEAALQMGEIKLDSLKAWSDNLREIEEQVKQIINSPAYQQQLLDLRIHGSNDQKITGVDSSTSSSANYTEKLGIISALDRARVLEKVEGTEKTSAPNQASVLPLAIGVIMGGGLAIGVSSITNTTELISNLQPLLAGIQAADIVPLINLLVAAPIYYHSWNNAVSNLSNKEAKNYLTLAQNFAKDVIRMVSDPSFNILGLLRRGSGVESLSNADQDRLARVLKLILVGVALSLLYAAQVGKVHGDQFGGMTPEELRDLLNGTIAPKKQEGKDLNETDRLTLNLIERAHEQLDGLSPEDRALAVTHLLDYVDQSRDVQTMTKPKDVFSDLLQLYTEPVHAPKPEPIKA